MTDQETAKRLPRERGSLFFAGARLSSLWIHHMEEVRLAQGSNFQPLDMLPERLDDSPPRAFLIRGPAIDHHDRIAFLVILQESRNAVWMVRSDHHSPQSSDGIARGSRDKLDRCFDRPTPIPVLCS